MAKLLTLRCLTCERNIRFVAGPLKSKPVLNEEGKDQQVHRFFDAITKHNQEYRGRNIDIVSGGFAD